MPKQSKTSKKASKASSPGREQLLSPLIADSRAEAGRVEIPWRTTLKEASVVAFLDREFHSPAGARDKMEHH